jgi:gas vesicle protein
MGFIRGLIAGVAVSAAAAAWYLSRSGQQARDQLQLERKLGEIGDEFDRRARDMQSQVSAQIADIQKRNGNGVAHAEDAIDSATATAAETAAQVEADAENVVDDVKSEVADAT